MNRIGKKSDTTRFTSDSDPLHFSTKVCVYTERTDYFVGARSVVSCAKRSIPFLFTIFESFRQQFVLSSDNVVRSKRFSMPSLFSIAILLCRMSLFPLTTITTDEARLDIEARGLWECRQERTLFDVRVFNRCAYSYRHAPLPMLCHRQEQLKRNAYEERVRQVERASFVPLVFTTSGSASPSAAVVLRRLAARLAEGRDLSYSTVMGWLRCRLSFCLLRCAVMCFRGSRFRRTTALDNVPVLACSAARVNFAA